MSIINDALRKAREERNRRIREKKEKTEAVRLAENPHLKQPPKEVQAPVKKISIKDRIKIKPLSYIVAACVLIIVILAIGIFINRKVRNEMHQYQLVEPQAPASRPAQASTRIGPSITRRASAPRSPQFVLSGVIHGEGAPMAIINENVYVAGDNIGKVKIVKISDNKVILEENGKEIILKVE